jgi:hypothetical protein
VLFEICLSYSGREVLNERESLHLHTKKISIISFHIYFRSKFLADPIIKARGFIDTGLILFINLIPIGIENPPMNSVLTLMTSQILLILLLDVALAYS